MAKRIKDREHVTTVTYAVFYAANPEGSSGLMFDCDASGNVDRSKLNPCARANLAKIERGEIPYVYSELTTLETSYVDPAEILCDCGDTVALYGFTNTCDSCNRDYNMSGQELAPRSQWGEDTGETLSDILRIR
jgi:hypothetical protein